MPNHTKTETNKYSIKILLHCNMKNVSYFSQTTLTTHISSIAKLFVNEPSAYSWHIDSQYLSYVTILVQYKRIQRDHSGEYH